MKLSVGVLPAPCLLLLVATSASASSVMALTEEQFVERSSIIGVVQVMRTETEVSRRGVFTHVELQFYQTLKGASPNDVIAIQVPGGVMGNGMEMRVDGAPRMKTGQLFLGFFHKHGGVLKTTAMSLGVMPIILDGNGDARVTQRNVGLSFVKPDGGTTHSLVTVNNEPLDAVLARFDDIVRRQSGSAPPPPVVDDPGVSR